MSTDPAVELVALAIVHDWMDHLGYTEEALAEADQDRDHARCDRTPEGWFCLDEDGNSHHPVHDEADEVAELVMFTLEHPALAGRLLPPVVQTREEAGHWSPNKSYVWACRDGGVDPNDHRYCELPISHVRTISTLADDGSPHGGATLTTAWRAVEGNEG